MTDIFDIIPFWSILILFYDPQNSLDLVHCRGLSCRGLLNTLCLETTGPHLVLFHHLTHSGSELCLIWKKHFVRIFMCAARKANRLKQLDCCGLTTVLPAVPLLSWSDSRNSPDFPGSMLSCSRSDSSPAPGRHSGRIPEWHTDTRTDMRTVWLLTWVCEAP